jgi:hypothetical protein
MMNNNIITVLLTVISGVLVYIIKNLIHANQELQKEKKNNSDAISNGVLALLKIQIIEYHDKYMTGNNIPTYVYENFDNLYSAYSALGGNGMIKKMKEDIDQLKVGKA